MIPLDEDEDLINQLIEHNPDFVEMLQARVREKSIPARKAAKRI